MSQYLSPRPGIGPRLWFAMRANRSFRYKVLALVAGALALAGHGLHLFGREALVRVAATSVTPITSLTAGTTGALQVSADRIDLWARATTGTATLNLVEYLPDDAKWAKVGADCAVTTDLTQCRYTAKRGSRYWHVYKASGTMSYVGLEPITLPAGQTVGSIEPGSTISLPVATSAGGTGLTSFTANRLFYSSSTSAIGQLGCSDGEVPSWSSGAIVCATPASVPAVLVIGSLTGVATTQTYVSSATTSSTGTTAAGNALVAIVPSGASIRLRSAVTTAITSGQQCDTYIKTATTPGGTLTTRATNNFVNSDGANVAKVSSTYTTASVVYVAVSALCTFSYSGLIYFTAERVG